LFLGNCKYLTLSSVGLPDGYSFFLLNTISRLYTHSLANPSQLANITLSRILLLQPKARFSLTIILSHGIHPSVPCRAFLSCQDALIAGKNHRLRFRSSTHDHTPKYTSALPPLSNISSRVKFYFTKQFSIRVRYELVFYPRNLHSPSLI
jgi:hypothetical protein